MFNGKSGAGEEKRQRIGTIINIIIIILGMLYLVHFVATAPEANAYDSYDINNYNCLHIALESQDWYSFNGLSTTVYIGCFNDSMCHAWLESSNGDKIIGYSEQFEFKEVLTLKEFNDIRR